MLDEYLVGKAVRLSREAPIPVLEFESRRTVPDGAANPAMNIARLGSHALQLGLVGDDDVGRELVAHLRAGGIDAGGIIIDTDRATTQKTRIVSQINFRFPQQLARLDRVDRHPPIPTIESAVIVALTQMMPTVDAVLVRDYRSGMLTPHIVQAVLTEAPRHGCLTCVYSQGNHDKYRGFDIIRANQHDTETYLGRSLRSEDEFADAMSDLLDHLAAQGIVIGRGAEGVSLLGKDVAYHHFRPANLTEVFDVIGAGDTSIAVLTLGLIAELDLAQAALLANYAAGLVVQKSGNATPTPAELRQAIQQWG